VKCPKRHTIWDGGRIFKRDFGKYIF